MLVPAAVTAPATPNGEVRRCQQCGQPAVVMVFEWKHTYSGIASGTSTCDYRCQHCGARFSIHPKVTNWTFIIMGMVLAWGVFPIGFTIFGWWRLRKNTVNPVVPDAARPVMKYQDGPPRRKCSACNNSVALTKVTRRTSRGLPSGTEYEYVCQPCKKPFVIESVWGHCVSVMSAMLIAAIAGAFLFAGTTPGWRFGGGGVAGLLAGFLVVQTATRISNHWRYPVID